MKKIVALLLALALLLCLAACKTQSPVPEIPQNDSDVEQMVETNVVVLKGPTGIGMAKMMSSSETYNYNFTVAAQPNEAVAAISSGKADIAAVPTNLAATLYAKTEKSVKMIAINTLGSLYILENGNTIKDFSDLKGKTICATGQGANPEYVLNYLLKKNGLKIGKDVNVEFKADHAELAALMASGECLIGMLPEPNVSSAMAKNENLRIALNLNDEWNNASDGANRLTMGCVIVRNEFLEKNPELVSEFLTRLEGSVNYAVENSHDTGALCEKFGIVPNAVLAEKAIPNCNLTVIKGENMKPAIDGYFNVLFSENPNSLGGALPDENFYLVP